MHLHVHNNNFCSGFEKPSNYPATNESWIIHCHWLDHGSLRNKRQLECWPQTIKVVIILLAFWNRPNVGKKLCLHHLHRLMSTNIWCYSIQAPSQWNTSLNELLIWQWITLPSKVWPTTIRKRTVQLHVCCYMYIHVCASRASNRIAKEDIDRFPDEVDMTSTWSKCHNHAMDVCVSTYGIVHRLYLVGLNKLHAHLWNYILSKSCIPILCIYNYWHTDMYFDKNI